MEKVLTLNTHRTCYGISQLGTTLTVGDLISLLQEFDEDTKVCFSNDNGYTYGEINEYDLQLESEEE